MNRHPRSTLPSVQPVADRIVATFERFLHVEAASGIALLTAAAVALLWANSPVAASYHALWHTPLSIGIGDLIVARPLEFWINDGLMTIFFLLVGLEIRREMHEGTLSTLRSATLPLAAALGGVAVPAVIYLLLSGDAATRVGWAVPTATDIAFAVGVLALLGKLVPASVRILLLAIAVIDDIVAVVVIAFFYSEGVALAGLGVAVVGVILVFAFQRAGVRSALLYLLPGAVLWAGLLQSGVHPTLAGVILGLLTPAVAAPRDRRPIEIAASALDDFGRQAGQPHADFRDLSTPLRHLKDAQRELLPPVVRIQMALHPWVAYGVMPLFALANAGVELHDINISDATTQNVVLAVIIALVIGKPLGILAGSWLAVRLGWCALPPGTTLRGVLLVGCLGGIGFTMAIFIATLAFQQPSLLGAAKLGVLLASAVAGTVGLLLGRHLLRAPAAATGDPPVRSDGSLSEAHGHRS